MMEVAGFTVIVLLAVLCGVGLFRDDDLEW